MKNVTVTLKINGVNTPLVYGEDFVIAGYTNNIKKGNMTVTITGPDDDTEEPFVSGTKTFKVKIVPQEMKPAE